MLHTPSTHYRSYSLHRLRASLAVAGVSLILAAGSASAGTAEQNALIFELAQVDATLSTATGDQLATAVTEVIAANPKFKPGVVAGEALKGAGSSAPDAGSKIANAVLANSAVTSANKLQVAADAAKTAATGKGPNVAQVPTFEQLFETSTADAISIATKIKTVTSAVGAVIGGEALNLSTDATKLTLANSAIQNAALKSSTQTIAQYVGATTADSAQFADALSDQNVKSTIKIAPGVVAGDPLNAGNIVSAIVNDAALSSVLKKAATLAANVAKVADIEEVVHVGQAIGAKVGSGAIPLSQVNTIVKGLVAGITSKPTTPTGENRQVNKKDEIGEVGAYFMNAIAANSVFQGTTAKQTAQATKIVVGLLKTIVAKSKSTVDVALQALVAPDVSGSVALTVKFLGANSTISSQVAAAILASLESSKTAKSIGGASLAASISAAVSEATVPGDVTKFENGTQPAGAVNDPETDIRNG